jgi:hypothetical protein
MNRPSPTASDIEQAKRNTAVARARVQTTAGALKQRLNPKALAADAAQTVRSKTGAVGDKASKRPAATAAVAGAAALFLFRKPVGKVLRRMFSRRARLERHEYKYRLQADRDRRRAEKEARRAEKEARRAEKEAQRAADDTNLTAAANDTNAA